jgi:hypothetical protein
MDSENGGTVLPCLMHFNRNYTLFVSLFMGRFRPRNHQPEITTQSPSSGHFITLIARQPQTIATGTGQGIMASKIKTSSIYAFFDIVAFFMATQSALSAPQPVKDGFTKNRLPVAAKI